MINFHASSRLVPAVLVHALCFAVLRPASFDLSSIGERCHSVEAKSHRCKGDAASSQGSNISCTYSILSHYCLRLHPRPCAYTDWNTCNNDVRTTCWTPSCSPLVQQSVWQAREVQRLLQQDTDSILQDTAQIFATASTSQASLQPYYRKCLSVSIIRGLAV